MIHDCGTLFRWGGRDAMGDDEEQPAKDGYVLAQTLDIAFAGHPGTPSAMKVSCDEFNARRRAGVERQIKAMAAPLPKDSYRIVNRCGPSPDQCFQLHLGDRRLWLSEKLLCKQPPAVMIALARQLVQRYLGADAANRAVFQIVWLGAAT